LESGSILEQSVGVAQDTVDGDLIHSGGSFSHCCQFLCFSITGQPGPSLTVTFLSSFFVNELATAEERYKHSNNF